MPSPVSGDGIVPLLYFHKFNMLQQPAAGKGTVLM